MNDQLRTDRFVRGALMASFFAAPDGHGLTEAELVELGSHFDVRAGELRDVLRVSPDRGDDGRYQAPSHCSIDLTTFYSHTADDPRDIEAFQFVWEAFRELNREYGAGKGKIEEAVLVARGLGAGLDEHGMRVAISIYVYFGSLRRIEPGLLQSHGLHNYGPKQQRAKNQPPPRFTTLAPGLIAHVRDVVSRRTDGRPLAKNPAPSFASYLKRHGLDGLTPWWTAVMTELSHADSQTQPTVVIVLSAALAEAALCVVGQQAQHVGGTMDGVDWDNPRGWKFNQMIQQSKRGQKPVLDGDLGARALRLNDLRQRIHAGRFWDKATTVPFDWRPDEAREARETLDQLLRACMAWLDANPGTG